MCDNRGLNIFAERHFENDRGLELPGTGAQNFSIAIRNG
jgi:hypothetical protein